MIPPADPNDDSPWAVLEQWAHLDMVGGPAVLIVGPFESEEEAKEYEKWTKDNVGRWDKLSIIGTGQMIRPDPDYREDRSWSGDRTSSDEGS